MEPIKFVKVISSHCHGGGRDLEEGEILEVGKDIHPAEAKARIWNRLMEPCAPPAPPKPPAATKGKEAKKGKEEEKGSASDTGTDAKK